MSTPNDFESYRARVMEALNKMLDNMRDGVVSADATARFLDAVGGFESTDAERVKLYDLLIGMRDRAARAVASEPS